MSPLKGQIVLSYYISNFDVRFLKWSYLAAFIGPPHVATLQMLSASSKFGNMDTDLWFQFYFFLLVVRVMGDEMDLLRIYRGSETLFL